MLIVYRAVRFLVLDEADRMMDLGFDEELKNIANFFDVRTLPPAFLVAGGYRCFSVYVLAWVLSMLCETHGFTPVAVPVLVWYSINARRCCSPPPCPRNSKSLPRVP